MTPTEQKIPATIAILTHNSEKTIGRCLESVKDFQEIIISDGGSTDQTLAIAQRYHAKIISQSHPGYPIDDFSRERQLMLDQATQPWFFYLDADEMMSRELRDEIHRITHTEDMLVGGYRVRYLKTSEDGSKPYRTYKEYYQVRLCRTGIGAYFVRPVHERIIIPDGFLVRQTEGPWYVPLAARDLHLRLFFPKAWSRTRLDASVWAPRGVIDAIRKAYLAPLRHIAAHLFKSVYTKITFGKDAVPLRYTLMRCVYEFCFMANFSIRIGKLAWQRLRAPLKTPYFFLAYVLWNIIQLFQKTGPVVLMYHAVSTEGGKLSVAPGVFRSQMEYLRTQRSVVSMDDILAFLEGKKTLPNNAVSVSIDDGYLDTYREAFPVLKEFRIPFTLFLTTNLRIMPELANLPRPTWDQLREMSAVGLATIGFHGHEHLRVGDIADNMSLLEKELGVSAALVEKEIGIRPKVYAYAFGARDSRIPTYLRSIGIDAGFGITDGTVTSMRNRYALPRVQIDSTMSARLFRYRTTGAVDVAYRLKHWRRSLITQRPQRESKE